MEDNSLEKPPTYEESAKDLGPIVVTTTPAIFEQMITCPPTTSIDANGSITISMDKLPTSASISNISGGGGGGGGNPSASLNGSSVSVDQMAEEVTALQRAYIHLYKRVHHFKSQMWYAGLAFVTLFLGFLLFFLAAYHPGHSQSAVINNGQGQSVTAVASHRTGKALVGGGGGKALDLVASNALDGDHQSHHQDDTELLLKHLSRIAGTTTTTMTTSAAALGNRDTLATSELFSSSNGQKISSSADSNGILQTAESNIHSEQTVKVMGALPSSSSSTSSTSTTTTMTTTTTTEVTDTDQTSGDDSHHPTESSSSPPKPNPQQTIPSSPSSNPHPHPSKDDTYNISIVVHSATVPNMDYLPLGRASDTYCDVFIDDVLVGSTPIIDNNNAPNWQYLLPKAYRVRAESTIRVDLLDRDHLKRDHIGGVVMLVGDLVNTNRLDRPVKFFHGRGDVWVTVKLV